MQPLVANAHELATVHPRGSTLLMAPHLSRLVLKPLLKISKEDNVKLNIRSCRRLCWAAADFPNVGTAASLNLAAHLSSYSPPLTLLILKNLIVLYSSSCRFLFSVPFLPTVVLVGNGAEERSRPGERRSKKGGWTGRIIEVSW